MNIETQFHLTPQVTKRGVQLFWKSYYFRTRELFLTGIFLCLLVFIGLVDGAKSWVNLIIIGLYGFIALWFWIVRFRIYLLLLKEKMNYYRQLAGGVTKLQLTDSAAILTSGEMRSEFEWGELKRIIESDEFLLLWLSRLNFTIIPIDQLSQHTLSAIRQKFAERTLAPTILQETAQHRARVGKVILRAAYLWASLMILIPVVLFLFIVFWLQKGSRVVVETHSGKFWVNVLKVESQPNYFMERVQVRGSEDMKVSLGMSSPREAGQSAQIYADGPASTCEVILKVNTSTNTSWHSELAGGVLDTTLPNPLTVSDIDTNLSGPYEKGSAVTLASLGDKKIQLSVK